MLRSQELQKLRNLNNPDILIIGAGINGASVFSQLANTGTSVVLVDKTDFGSGASNASSRMAHGGIKYLETGELPLVKEAVASRNELLKSYPNYIQPLKITVPVTSWFGGMISAAIRLMKPSYHVRERGALLIKIGLLIYDFISRPTRRLPKHAYLSKEKTREQHVGIGANYISSFNYFEGAVSHPERIAFEMVDEVVKCKNDCAAVNHCEFVGETPYGIALRDTHSGEEFTINPKIVVNATGAWVDLVNARFSGAAKKALIDGAKGSHLILDSNELRDAMSGSGFVWSNEDGRLSIMYPLGEKVILGSTELRVDCPDEVMCEEDEQAYLIEALRDLFPDIDIREDDIIFRYSGVRPLLVSNESDPRGATRDHHIDTTEPGGGRSFFRLDLVGGKWTTFAPFGREVAEQICGILGKTYCLDDPATGKGVVKHGEASALAKGEQARYTNLITKYGRQRGSKIATFCVQTKDANLEHLAGYSKNEISWFIQHESALTLEDIFFRRTNIMFTERISLNLVIEVTKILAKELQLEETEAKDEMLAFVERLQKRHGVPIDHASCPREFLN